MQNMQNMQNMQSMQTMQNIQNMQKKQNMHRFQCHKMCLADAPHILWLEIVKK